MNDLQPRNDCGQYYIVASVRSWNFKFGGQKISYLLAERSLCSIFILHFVGKHNGRSFTMTKFEFSKSVYSIFDNIISGEQHFSQCL